MTVISLNYFCLSFSLARSLCLSFYVCCLLHRTHKITRTHMQKKKKLIEAPSEKLTQRSYNVTGIFFFSIKKNEKKNYCNLLFLFNAKKKWSVLCTAWCWQTSGKQFSYKHFEIPFLPFFLCPCSKKKGMSFTPKDVADSIREEIPEFEVLYFFFIVCYCLTLNHLRKLLNALFFYAMFPILLPVFFF